MKKLLALVYLLMAILPFASAQVVYTNEQNSPTLVNNVYVVNDSFAYNHTQVAVNYLNLTYGKFWYNYSSVIAAGGGNLSFNQTLTDLLYNATWIHDPTLVIPGTYLGNLYDYVGIGTQVPTQPLDVEGTTPLDFGALFSNTNMDAYVNNQFVNDGGLTGYVGEGGSNVEAAYANRQYLESIDGTGVSLIADTGDIRFFLGGFNAGDEKGRIDTAGNFIIRNLSANNKVNATQFCLGADCRTAWTNASAGGSGPSVWTNSSTQVFLSNGTSQYVNVSNTLFVNGTNGNVKISASSTHPLNITDTTTGAYMDILQGGATFRMNVMGSNTFVLNNNASAGFLNIAANGDIILDQSSSQSGKNRFYVNGEGKGFRVGDTTDTNYMDFISGGLQSQFKSSGSRPILFTVNTSTDVLTITPSGNVGINTANPSHIFNVVGNANITKDVLFGQHIGSYGGKPSIANCGTNPAISGTDIAGNATVGAGIITSCEVDFATPYAAAPVCTVSDNSGTISAGITTLNRTTMITGFSASLAGGQLYYICVGN